MTMLIVFKIEVYNQELRVRQKNSLVSIKRIK